MAVQVTLEDHTGNKKHRVKMSEAASVEKLIPATITALGLVARREMMPRRHQVWIVTSTV